MKAEFLAHKVMLFRGDFFLSIYQDGTIHRLKCGETSLEESNFSIQDNAIFDRMFLDFINHDYTVIE
jgi:hypothetical protein